MSRQRLPFAAVAPIVVFAALAQGVAGELRVVEQQGALQIFAKDQPLARYVYADPDVPRPYFIDVRPAKGVQLTRNHPPQLGDDKDHPHHTGFFFSFGDLNGVDYWHGRGKCRHVRFAEGPSLSGNRLHFTVINEYLAADSDRVVCQERSSHTIRWGGDRCWFEYDITLSAVDELVRIGSKEEGGLAVRVATPLAVTAGKGGRMVDSEGRVNGDAIWGRQADWVCYEGTVAGQSAGVVVMSFDTGSGGCWWHARDYGLLTANPFGPLNSSLGGRRLAVGETLRLRLAICAFAHRAESEFSPAAAFEEYLAIVESGK